MAKPWCLQPGTMNLDAFIPPTSHQLGITPEELRHKRTGVPEGNWEGGSTEGRQPGRSTPRFLGPGSKACILASETAPPPVF